MYTMNERKDDPSDEETCNIILGKEHKSDNLIIEVITQIQSHLKEFQSNFNFIKDNFSLEQLENDLNSIECAGYNAFLAYSLCSLFYGYLKLSGAFLNNHPIKNEIKRVQQLMKKIKETADENEKGKMRSTVNKEAAKRIIESCVSYNKSIKKKKPE